MSTLSVNTITAETGNTVSLASGKTLNASQGLTTPAGHVIQVVSSIFASSFTSSSTSLVDVGHSVDITPKSATSTLYLEWVGNVNSNVITGMGVAFREGSVSIGGGSSAGIGIFYYNASGVNNTHDNQSMMTSTSSTGVTLRTFKISTKTTHGTANSHSIQGQWGPCMLRVMEIQG
tara:strand:+ start:474 stop:1001 length:528 start_codon:yes stop_codon:yes gene_type:complete